MSTRAVPPLPAAAPHPSSPSRFSPRRWYGEGPLHLLLLAATFCLAGYAGVRLLDGDTLGVLLWFAGSALLHDLVLLPVYAGADRALRAALGPRRALVNFVRVPVFLSGLLLLIWFPLITRRTERRYVAASGTSPDVYLSNWLLITGVLFALSALWLLVRALRSRTGGRGRRRETKARPSALH
ncbi:Lipoprotein [Streptomyces microflavus DSM 40593]|uniref:Lipoprotein n=1 Tax=Streptomyces microflavus DSM 40593 TaxID=1303692 RepID=N0CZA7_STRMI|nr:Lipoprotein [Streptomyces microflavus DSM 40593]